MLYVLFDVLLGNLGWGGCVGFGLRFAFCERAY